MAHHLDSNKMFSMSEIEKRTCLSSSIVYPCNLYFEVGVAMFVKVLFLNLPSRIISIFIFYFYRR